MAKHARQMPPISKKKIIIISVAALLIVAAILVILNREAIFGGSDEADNGIKSSQPFTFENGSQQSFALFGEDLAIASSTGLQVVDENGETLSRKVFSMKAPCVSSGGETCLFYDVGGTALKAFFGSSYTEMDTKEPIIAASVNSSGYIAVAAEESGYKGSVTVYDSKGHSIYKWYSGTGYILDALVTPDCSRMIALCADSTGSVLHFFRLSDEKEYTSVTLSSELAFRLGNLGGGDICALSNNALHFFDKNGNEDNTFSFENNYLVDYEFTENCCALAVSKYISGSAVTITGFTSSGKERGSAELNYAPASMSSQGGRLLVFGSENFDLLSIGMDVVKSGMPPAGYKNAVLMLDGTAMLLASYHGEKITLK